MSICCGRPQSVCELIARVKVVGVDGDTSYEEQYKNCQAAIDELGMAIALDKLSPEDSLAQSLGITKTPAIIIGSKLVSEGEVQDKDAVVKMLRKAVFGF